MATGKRKSARASSGGKDKSKSSAKEVTVKDVTDAETNGAEASDDEGPCPACPDDRVPLGESEQEEWIRCDACTKWFHWRCVDKEGGDPDSLDKWFCKPCLAVDPKRKVTVRPPARKSARQKKVQEELASVSGDSGKNGRWSQLMHNKPIKMDGFRRMKGNEVGAEWLEADETALKEPIVIENSEGLGMKMPPPEFTIADVADRLGENTPVEVIDVATQSNCPGWTLGKWAEYYGTEPSERDKVRNVISLEVSGTPLADEVLPPRIVRELDWVDKYWPKNKRGRGHPYPKVQLYCLMGVAGAWTDWHIDFAGSSVYYHVLHGAKIFYFIRPTPSNLAAYERWSGSDMQSHTWLGDLVDEVVKVELTTGNTMIIPTGWIHAVHTPTDTLVFGGNFLHSYNISTQLKVCEIENKTFVPKKFRFPLFTKLCWYVAEKCVSDLKNKEEFSPRVLDSFETLSSYLVSEVRAMERGSDQAKKAAREHVPGDRIKDPAALARELRWRVRLASGYNSDDEGHSRKRGKAHATAIAELVVNGTTSTHGHNHKRKREGSVSDDAMGTRKPFRHFKPKVWEIHQEHADDSVLSSSQAPRLDKSDSWKEHWSEWTNSWNHQLSLVNAEVSTRRTVLIRARRTAQGVERQRIERIVEDWSLADPNDAKLIVPSEMAAPGVSLPDPVSGASEGMQPTSVTAPAAEEVKMDIDQSL